MRELEILIKDGSSIVNIPQAFLQNLRFFQRDIVLLD